MTIYIILKSILIYKRYVLLSLHMFITSVIKVVKKKNRI
jgi:hypothetical protein